MIDWLRCSFVDLNAGLFPRVGKTLRITDEFDRTADFDCEVEFGGTVCHRHLVIVGCLQLPVVYLNQEDTGRNALRV